MNAQEVFVVSDIDGTLVPHPYFSGIDVAGRAQYIRRVIDLFDRPNFALVTGRMKAGWERLFKEAGVARRFPKILGLEFGAQLYVDGELVHERAQNPLIHAIAEHMAAALGEVPEFQVGESFEAQREKGLMRGYVIEEKATIVQIDWNFPDPGVSMRFVEFLTEKLNPYLTRSNEVYAQVLPHRIDVCEAGFVPKAHVWADLCARVERGLLPAGARPRAVVLGDEIYDGYMFNAFEALAPRTFSSVESWGVGKKKVPFAKGMKSDEAEALALVEALLGGSVRARSTP